MLDKSAGKYVAHNNAREQHWHTYYIQMLYRYKDKHDFHRDYLPAYKLMDAYHHYLQDEEY